MRIASPAAERASLSSSHETAPGSRAMHAAPSMEKEEVMLIHLQRPPPRTPQAQTIFIAALARDGSA